MEVKTQHTSPVADKAQQGVMELLLINHPLDCPVCDKGGECPLQNQAMTNGRSESRFEDVKRTYPKPINISSQVLLDRERCVLCARCTRFSEQIAGDPFIALVERGALPAGRHLRGEAVRVLLLGQHRPDLPGRRAHRRGLPVPGPPVRPRLDPERLRALRERVRHRAPTTVAARCCAGWRNDPEVNEEWNCDKGRWAFTYARVARPPRAADGPRRTASSGSASWPEALDGGRRRSPAASRVRRARRRPGQRRGRLRLRQVRPHGARHQRRRLPRPAALRRGGRVPGQQRRRPPDPTAVRSPTPTSRTRRRCCSSGFEPEDESPIVFLRLRKAFRSNQTAVYRRRPVADAGLAKVGGTSSRPRRAPSPRSAARSARGAGSAWRGSDGGSPTGACGEGAVILVGERLATVPGARRAAAALAETTGARLAWIPRRAGERGALEAGAFPTLLPGGRPVRTPGPAPRSPRPGASSGCRTSAGRDTAAILAAAASGELGALVVGGVDPVDLGSAGAARGPEPALRRVPRVRSVRGDRRRRRGPAGRRRTPRRPARSSTGRAASAPSSEALETATSATTVRSTCSPTRWASSSAPARCARSAPRWRRSGRGRERAPPRPPSAPATCPASRTGTLVLATWRHLLDTAGCRTASRSSPAPRPGPVARVSATTAERSGVTDGDTSPSRPATRPSPCRSPSPRWLTTSSGCRRTPRAATARRRSAATPGAASPSQGRAA